MTGFSKLTTCAGGHLRSYTDPHGNRAFAAYDRLGSPNRLEPVDLLAPAILQAPVRGEFIIAMYQAQGTYRQLRVALEAVVAESTGRARFEEQDLTDDDNSWSLVREALRASDSTPGIKASIVTKILHRKRPNLVPIFDSKVAQYYGLSTRAPWELWPLIQGDVIENAPFLDDLAGGTLTPDNRPLSRLRTLDIVIWEHMTSGECA